jgi:hypothetical protein
MASISSVAIWASGRQESVDKAEEYDQEQEVHKEDCVTSVVWDTSMNTIAGIESTPIASLKFMPLCEAQQVQQVQQVQQAQQWLEEWRVLAELRDATGFANWTKNKDGWGTLEEHHDPSRCAGVTMESGKITGIDLVGSSLMGGESHVHYKVAPVVLASVLTHISVLPESFGQLSSLQGLGLGGNKLTGTIYF